MRDGYVRAIRGEWTLANFGCTLHTVTTEREIPLAFRIELTRRREQLGLTIREAARRTNFAGPKSGISESRWGHIERGSESKAGGIQIPANPRRSTIIKMAVALNWPIKDALECAGKIGPTRTEEEKAARDFRQELDLIIDRLSEDQVRALYRHLRTMIDPDATDTDPTDDADDEIVILGPPDDVENHHAERDDAGSNGNNGGSQV